MDRIENAPAAPETRTPRREGSQSKLPPILLAIVTAAVLLRIVTGLAGRQNAEAGPGLVRWVSQEKAASAARSDVRPVLYDFTAAWCMPCHRLDTEGWSDPEIAALVNGSYEPARVMDREREDGRNSGPVEELQRRYSVTAFPTLIVASPDGLLMAKHEGYGGKERLRRFLEEARHQSPRPQEGVAGRP
jgi:thiol:disulfide interchange protein